MSDIIQVNPLVFGGEGESVHANMFFKLWENPSPSASFAAQDITLSSDDYDFLLWETIAATSASVTGTDSVIVSKGDNVWLTSNNTTNNGARAWKRRATRTDDTHYSVADAYEATGTTAATVANAALIPIAVYGFKKSLDITAIVSEVSTDATKCIMSDNVTDVETAINNAKIKADTFSGTTDGSGNVKIANYSDNRVVVSAMLNQAAINFPFVYTNGHTYIHVMAENGSAKTSTAVSGTYYYLDK